MPQRPSLSWKLAPARGSLVDRRTGGGGYRRSVRPIHFLVVALLIGLLAATPLAHASPPDPLWIAGIYDDAD